jgi:8-oxo-dGTP diphosphatase
MSVGSLVVVGIVASHLGVLAGRRRDGQPPWTFPGGKVEQGETPKAAVVREVWEEAGVHVRPGEDLGWRVHPQTGRTCMYLACQLVDAAGPVWPRSSELTAVRWLTLFELGALMGGRDAIYAPVLEYLERMLP